MKLYEVVFIGRQDLSQQQVDALGVSLGLSVTQNGGEIVRSEYCGFRNLAYPINKNHKGHYYIIQMKANKTSLSELDRAMKFNEDIIRYLIVRANVFENKENLISQAKTFNDGFNGASNGGIRDTGYRSAPKANFVEEESIDKTEKVEIAEEAAK